MMMMMVVVVDSVNECNVSFRDIDTAIKKLNKRKDNGSHGLYSDHIILATNKFKTIIIILLNCILILVIILKICLLL